MAKLCVECARENRRAFCRSYYKTHPRPPSTSKVRAWRKKDPERARAAARRGHLKRKFNLTPTAYEALLTAQDGVCAICRRPPRRCVLAVDHAHDASRRVRGLLCNLCNAGIGGLRDDPALLRAALAYLER